MPPLTRRRFCATAAALALQPQLHAAPTSRIDVATIEHDRVLAEAELALKTKPYDLLNYPSPVQGADPHAFYATPASPDGKGFRAHANALIDLSADVAALTAAYVLTHNARYASRATANLHAWFVDPATRMSPALDGTQTPAGLVDAAPLAEIARAIPFLGDALAPANLASLQAWFKDLLAWLNSAHNALIARELKDHAGSTWLLLSAAIGRLLDDEATLNACRLRFKRPTLRNQIAANGDFPHEVATPYPFRNSLFNFDLLAGTCELLSTPFASLWTFELDDGPGLRGAAAFLYPLIQDPVRWPYMADADHFRDVPRRRPALLLAGRAYDRPEYVELWRALPQPGREDPLRGTFPIRQPLLWTMRPPHTA